MNNKRQRTTKHGSHASNASGAKGAKDPKGPKGRSYNRKQQAAKKQKLEVKAIVRHVVQPQIERGDMELFHTRKRKTYVTLKITDHYETYELPSPDFEHWLSRSIYKVTGEMPTDATIKKVVRVLKGEALYNPNSKQREVFVRVAEAGGNVYLDLADDQWRVIEITPTGWWFTEDAPVRFVRSADSLPLPTPILGGNLWDIFNIVHISKREDQILFLGWLVGLLQTHAACPILFLLGGEGVAKTSACNIAAALIDPAKPQHEKTPKSERDMIVSAQHVHVVYYDNISNVDDKFSDALCRMVTGSGLRERKLYSNGGLFSLSARKPVLMNGIALTVTRGDLLDRMITLKLDRFSDADRRADRKMTNNFETLHPALLGALLTAASTALRNLPHVNITNGPRLIDHAEWVVASEIESVPGEFLKAYHKNRRALSDASIELVPEGLEVIALVEACNGDWTGSYKDLLTQLNQRATEQLMKDPEWPKSERKLRSDLARIERGLFAAGYKVHWLPNDAISRRAMVRIERTARPEVKQRANGKDSAAQARWPANASLSFDSRLQ